MSDIDLGRIVPDDVLVRIEQEVGFTHESGSTVADIIRGQAGIGYGGHFDECSDEEDAVHVLIARDDEELVAIEAARREYTNALREAINAVVWPTRGGP